MLGAPLDDYKDVFIFGFKEASVKMFNLSNPPEQSLRVPPEDSGFKDHIKYLEISPDKFQ